MIPTLENGQKINIGIILLFWNNLKNNEFVIIKSFNSVHFKYYEIFRKIGYDIKRFIDNIPERFLCPICSDIFEDLNAVSATM